MPQSLENLEIDKLFKQEAIQLLSEDRLSGVGIPSRYFLDKDFALALFTKTKWNISNYPIEAYSHKDFAMLIAQHPDFNEHIMIHYMKQWYYDPDVMVEVIHKHVGFTHYVNLSLWSDKKFCLDALNKSTQFLSYFSEDLLEDKDFAYQMLEISIKSFFRIKVPSILRDKKIISQILDIDTSFLSNFPDESFHDLETTLFILDYAIFSNPTVLSIPNYAERKHFFLKSLVRTIETYFPEITLENNDEDRPFNTLKSFYDKGLEKLMYQDLANNPKHNSNDLTEHRTLKF